LNSEILPSLYKLYRNDRIDGYGGVLIGVQSDITSDLIDIPPHLEVCTILLHLSRSVDLLFICIYRPINTDITNQENLCNYTITIARKYPNANICCTGDFNLPNIDWEMNLYIVTDTLSQLMNQY